MSLMEFTERQSHPVDQSCIAASRSTVSTG